MAEVETPPAPAAPSTPDDAAAADEPSTSQALTPKTTDDNIILSSTTQPDGTVVQLLQTPAGKKIKKIIRKKRRPARVQVDPATLKTEQPVQTGTIFNIWFSKWSGGDREDRGSREHAKTRCIVARDAGYTRADGVPGAVFCSFFARGACPRGRECDYLHRVPDQIWDLHSGTTDVFGRDKTADYRDDMSGPGSFLRQNRTLYVGRIHPTDNIEEVVSRHFSEWGPIERIRCLPARGVAFVTYRTEALAQFAKEAMSDQSLDNDEILNVRWATVDPNPASQKREARAIEEQAAEAVRRVLPHDVVAEIMGDESAKRRRTEEGSFGLQGYQAPDQIWYKTQKDRQLSAREEPKLLEQGGGANEEDQDAAPLGKQAQEAPSGLLGSSTLSALSGFDASGNAAHVNAKPQNSGPLVDYGSGDDDDDW